MLAAIDSRPQPLRTLFVVAWSCILTVGPSFGHGRPFIRMWLPGSGTHGKPVTLRWRIP
jgi:hypothetical protein